MVGMKSPAIGLFTEKMTIMRKPGDGHRTIITAQKINYFDNHQSEINKLVILPKFYATLRGFTGWRDLDAAKQLFSTRLSTDLVDIVNPACSISYLTLL
jgi:hypothetical protein